MEYARIAAAVKQLDETGFRIGGSLQETRFQWLHIAATTKLTFYRISTKRGDMIGNLAGIAAAAAPNLAPLTIPASTTHR